MNWAGATVYAFDSESTGVDVFEDRVVTATVVKVVGDQAVGKREWLINPGIEIPEGATAIHGITNEQVRDHGFDPTEAIDLIAETVTGVLRSGFPLIIFNAAFDLSILEVECRRHELTSLNDRVRPSEWFAVIDPMVIAKGQTVDSRDWANLKGTGRMKLPALCQRFGVPFSETHDATADALGAALLAKAEFATWNALGALSPADLHARQLAWRHRDQDSLREHFKKSGKEYDTVDSGWPMHTRLAPVNASTTTFKKPAGVKA